MSLGSEPFSPPKETPNGTPFLSFPAGTLIPGYPPSARMEATSDPGDINASKLLSFINFSNPSLQAFVIFASASLSNLPIPLVSSASTTFKVSESSLNPTKPLFLVIPNLLPFSPSALRNWAYPPCGMYIEASFVACLSSGSYPTITPTVGLIPTTELALDGLKMDPAVSVPSVTVTKFAAADIAEPVLEPDGSADAT
nr:predicted protein [Ipomoea batatas]